MTIDEIRKQLDEASTAMESLGPNTAEFFELKILRSQLKKEIAVGSIDISKDISAITVADVSKLAGLTADLKKVIANEQQAVAIAKRIIGIAKVGLNAAGVPI